MRFCQAIWIFFCNKIGGDPAFGKAGMLRQIGQEGHVMAQAAHDIAINRPAQFRDGRCPVLAPDNQFGDHRVIEHGDFSAIIATAIDPHLSFHRLRLNIAAQAACRRQEATLCIFCI